MRPNLCHQTCATNSPWSPTPARSAEGACSTRAHASCRYVKLTQRLHTALNSIFFPPAAVPDAPSLPETVDEASASVLLKGLADEAEANFDFGSAATYHKERVSAARHVSSCWFDYATFLMRTGDAPFAEECSREAIALAPTSAEALLVHGGILASRGDCEGAEPFLKASLDVTTPTAARGARSPRRAPLAFAHG